MQLEVHAIARQQFGLITRSQALQVMSAGKLRQLLRTSALVKVHPGVYRMLGAPSTWSMHMRAAQLAVSGEVLASGESAGRVWQFKFCEAAGVEIVVPHPTSLHLEGVDVRCTRKMDVGTTEAGIPLTGRARTIVDLSAQMHPAKLDLLIDDAFDRRLLEVSDVYEVLDTIGTRGRGLTACLQAMLAKHDEVDRNVGSGLHRTACRWLKMAGMNPFVTEYPITVRGTQRYLDIAWPECKLAIEVDGFRWHRSRSKFDDDRRRGNGLTAMGWEVLQLTSAMAEAEFIADVKMTLTRLRCRASA